MPSLKPPQLTDGIALGSAPCSASAAPQQPATLEDAVEIPSMTLGLSPTRRERVFS